MFRWMFQRKPSVQKLTLSTPSEDPSPQELIHYEKTSIDIISSLKDAGINLFAVDFDLTLVDEHTGGAWTGSAEELAPRIRPIFKTLVPKLLDSGLAVAVVTFSPQVELISEVLSIQYKENSKRIVIRGCDGSWDLTGLGRRYGKQMHIQSAIDEINQNHPLPVSLSSTVLVDDDFNNIRVAVSNRVRAVRCFPDNPSRLITDLTKINQVSP